MKPEGAAYGPLWAGLLDTLASEAPGPGSRTLCLNFRPGWESGQIHQLHQQTAEMQALLRQQDWPLSPGPESAKNDWLKLMLAQPGVSAQALIQFLTGLGRIRELLSQQRQALPNLWKLGQELQPEPALLGMLSPGRPLSKDAQKLLQQRQSRIKTMREVLDRLGLIVARARYGIKVGGVLPKIGGSMRWHLLQWTPERLSELKLDIMLDAGLQTLILTGAHGSGKTRLLQSLYLACLMHQAGIPLRCGAESVLPVFSGLWLLESENLSDRLERLKPLLRSQPSGRLILIDDYFAHSAPGEAYALGKALLERLNTKGSLTVAATHHPLLARIAGEQGPIRTLGLEREGSRQGGKLSLQWHQIKAAGLLARARQAGWPNDLLVQAEAIQQSLGQLKSKGAPVVAKGAKQPAIATPAPPKPSPLKPIQADAPAGATVYLPGLSLYGELIGPPDRRGRVQVRVQGMTLEVAADQVVLSSRRKEKKADPGGVRIQTWSASSDACDLHGLTVDEALPLLDKFLDTAYFQGLNPVRVVHGKGTSALRRAVHRQLDALSYVRGYRLGHPGEGDSGVTVVELGD